MLQAAVIANIAKPKQTNKERLLIVVGRPLLGRRQPALQAGRLEGGVRLELVAHEVTNFLQEVGQVGLGRLATAGGRVVTVFCRWDRWPSSRRISVAGSGAR